MAMMILKAKNTFHYLDDKVQENLDTLTYVYQEALDRVDYMKLLGIIMNTIIKNLDVRELIADLESECGCKLPFQIGIDIISGISISSLFRYLKEEIPRDIFVELTEVFCWDVAKIGRSSVLLKSNS